MTSPWGDRNDHQAPEPPSGAGRGKVHYWWIAGAILTVAGAYWLVTAYPPGETYYGTTVPRLIYLTILLLVIGFGVYFVRRPGIRKSLSYILIWVGIGFVLFVGYAFRDEVSQVGNRLLAEISPGTAVATGERSLAIRRADDGHFYLGADVNGARIRFLVDTGATVIVLTKGDARAMGFDPAALNYAVPSHTANGIAYNAQVKIRRITVGALTVQNITALVAGGDLRQSLLGTNFLRRLASYQVEGNSLKLSW